MDRHKSCYKGRERSKRKKRRHSSSSSESEDRQREERVRRLESTVDSLDRRSPHSQSRGSCIHKGDELMIPLFDPTRDDLVIEKWIERGGFGRDARLGRTSNHETHGAPERSRTPMI